MTASAVAMALASACTDARGSGDGVGALESAGGGAAGRASTGAPDASVAEARDPGLATYARVREIIDRSCAYQRCHSGVPIGGGLSMPPGADHAAVLVGVPACEYGPMARVEPGAPERSWLMIKLTSAVRPATDAYADYILFEPDADWDASARACPDMSEEGVPLFGQRMPLTAPNMLDADALETIRAWIAEGAPH